MVCQAVTAARHTGEKLGDIGEKTWPLNCANSESKSFLSVFQMTRKLVTTKSFIFHISHH